MSGAFLFQSAWSKYSGPILNSERVRRSLQSGAELFPWQRPPMNLPAKAFQPRFWNQQGHYLPELE